MQPTRIKTPRNVLVYSSCIYVDLVRECIIVYVSVYKLAR